jgi:hypothetical protein
MFCGMMRKNGARRCRAAARDSRAAPDCRTAFSTCGVSHHHCRRRVARGRFPPALIQPAPSRFRGSPEPAEPFKIRKRKTESRKRSENHGP